MKTIKKLSIFLGVLIIIGVLFLGFKFGSKYYQSYQNNKALSNTVLDVPIDRTDSEKIKNLNNGQILSKTKIDLSEIPPIWNKVSEGGSLITNYQHLAKINFYVIVYKSDSLLVNGIIAEPKEEGTFPVIIFNRGGNKEIGKMAKAKTLHSLIRTSAKLVAEGYLVIASCYREEDEFGGNDLNDVLYLAETVKSIPKADPKRIGMFGWSRGGMMTYLALKKVRYIKTAVIGNGPSDMEAIIKARPKMESMVCAKLIPNYKEHKKEALQKRSVIYWANQLDKNASLLLLCGTKDKQVNPNQADKIAKILTDIHYDFRLEKFETDHKFSGKAEEKDKLLIEWFNERL
ncbi:MAG: alpha/beta hydrolase family protein [Aureispira sp.]